MTSLRVGIRARLMLWNVTVVMLIVGGVCLVIYAFVHRQLESQTVARLETAYRTVATIVRRSEADLFDVMHIEGAVPFRVETGGGAFYASESWGEVGVPLTLPAHGVWRASDGRLFRVQTGTVEETNALVAVAQDVTAIEESLRTLRLILIALVPCALVAAVLGSEFLAGRALSPITSMTRKAREITAERLAERLPVSDPNDEIGHLAHVFNDTLTRLEESFARLRRFTADASHELRTPLTAIKATGEVALRSSENGGSCREAVATMLEEADRLGRLIENLLTLARADAGATVLDRHDADLAALIREVIDELRVLAEEKDQELVLDTAPAVVAPVDARILRHAVANVLHNAIRYAPEGGHVRVSLGLGDGGWALIDVTDDGPGIPPADREKVFDRFSRVGDARSRANGGAGLGLAIARSAVVAHGGTVEIRETGRPGCCCRISIPTAGAIARESQGEVETMTTHQNRFWLGVTFVLSAVVITVGFPAFLRMFGLPKAFAWMLAVVAGVWLTHVIRAWSWSLGSKTSGRG